jgi:hypothetical protein
MRQKKPVSVFVSLSILHQQTHSFSSRTPIAHRLQSLSSDPVGPFTVRDSLPRFAPISERIPLDANRVAMLQDWSQHFQLWVKSFTHHWLNVVHEALSTFETSGCAHYAQHKRLHEASKVFFAAYREFRDTNMLSPGYLSGLPDL